MVKIEKKKGAAGGTGTQERAVCVGACVDMIEAYYLYGYNNVGKKPSILYNQNTQSWAGGGGSMV